MISRWPVILVLVLLLSSCAGSTHSVTVQPQSVTLTATPAVTPAHSTAVPAATQVVGPTGAATSSPAVQTAVQTPPGNDAQASPPAAAGAGPAVAKAIGTVEAQLSPGPPAFSHVFIIIMENKEAKQVLGDPAAPYLNSLATQYARAENYYSITHPSLPNYLALTAGQNFGITSDCTDCFISSTANIVTQLEAAGRSWKAYLESMPQPCYQGPDTEFYGQRHNPFIYYDNVRTNPSLCQKIVPLTQLEADIKANDLPDYVWITPDTCSDMHDCPISTGDRWLQTWVPKILATTAWQDQGVLFLTFDEGASNAGCCKLAAGGKVDTLVISPLVEPGFVSTANYNHFSLLRTIEESWDLPLLANAGSHDTPAMLDFFTTSKP